MGPPSFWTHPGRFLAFLGSLALPWSERDKAGLARATQTRKKGLGYFKEQSTQPQTIGYSLADSPVGLLAWIYEKLVNWSYAYPWTDDEGACAVVHHNGRLTSSGGSADMDICVLVFAGGACCICADLL